MRGTPEITKPDLTVSRIIPAYAGNTFNLNGSSKIS